MDTTSPTAADEGIDAGTAWAELGVSDELLSDDERRILDEQGYLILDGLLEEGVVAEMGRILDDLLAVETAAASTETGVRRKAEEHLAMVGRMLGDEVPAEIRDAALASLAPMREALDHADLDALRPMVEAIEMRPGVDYVADLVNKDSIFDQVFSHPRVLAAATHVLGPELQVFGLNLWAPHIGEGAQPLHSDWGQPVPDGDYKVCNSIWMIDEFTEENGPTRIVPGSHRSDHPPQDELEGDANRSHPSEIRVTGPAGRVVVFNSHAWHGGTTRIGGSSRRALFCAFAIRSMPQLNDQRANLRPETDERLSRAQKWLLDVL